MSEIEFVSESTVKLVEAAASDDMVCYAAWVSNFGDPSMHEDKVKPDKYEWDAYDYETGKFGPSPKAQAWDKRQKGLINFLYQNKHMSPFEHGHFTFFIETPLFVAREFMRHRTWSYNEMSGRYTKMPARFWIGKEARTQAGKIGNYTFESGGSELTGLYWAEKERNVTRAWESYNKLLDAGIAKEQSREDMPLSLMTQFYASANPRNVMQYLALRDDKHALKEIREVAEQIRDLFAEAMPVTYEAYKSFDWRDDKAYIKTLEAELEELRFMRESVEK